MNRLALPLLVLIAWMFAGSEPVSAQAGSPPASVVNADAGPGTEPTVADSESAIGLPLLDDLGGEDGLQLSAAVEIALVLTVLSLLPAILISLTCFTRIVIVLSFVRRALSVQELPPNPILIGLALFLTSFVMGPVFKGVYDAAYVPYKAGEIDVEQAGDFAWNEMSAFLISNTRQAELDMFIELAEVDDLDGGSVDPVDLPFRVVVPAFVLSELKTAFQMGFLLFLPFLVIDLVVASVLISMGMFMLPPVMISTPFKILIFVLVDGWRLITESLVTSFIV